MKISIAMTTYNGARYLKEQLDSFLYQSRLPDELVICDDSSSDSTVEIAEECLKNAPFTVTIIRNQTNLGFTKNFVKSMSKTNGDLIFLCDQDDIWYPNKIQNMVALFEVNRDLQIAIHDCGFCDQDGNLLGGSLLQNKIRFKVKHDNFIHGCCTVITRELRDISFPLPSLACGNYGYDEWLHFVGIYLGSRKVVGLQCQLYRRHEMNVSSSGIFYSASIPGYFEKNKYLLSRLINFCSNSDQHKRMLNERLQSVQLITKRVEVQINDCNRDRYLHYIQRLKMIEIELTGRIALPSYSRLIRIVPGIYAYMCGRYRFSSGWRSLLVDLIK